MPKFLERKLEKEYGKGNPRVYATLNSLGFMKGSKETAKGRAMEKKHKMAKKMTEPKHEYEMKYHKDKEGRLMGSIGKK